MFSSDGGQLPIPFLVGRAQHKVDELMLCDRNLDVLLLAHQLWEEDDAPKQPQHSYWLEAAHTVLASKVSRLRPPHLGEAAATHRVGVVQFGSSPIIKLGRAGRMHVVRLVRDCKSCIPANLP